MLPVDDVCLRCRLHRCWCYSITTVRHEKNISNTPPPYYFLLFVVLMDSRGCNSRRTSLGVFAFWVCLFLIDVRSMDGYTAKLFVDVDDDDDDDG